MLVTSRVRGDGGARAARRVPVVAALAALAVLALAPSALATNYQTYTDAAGDNGSAPDITRRARL